MSVKISQFLISSALCSLIAGCGALPNADDILPDKKVEYKRSRQAEKNLEIPPDLTKSSINDELVIPNTSNTRSTTLSGLMEQERIQGRNVKQASVLPEVKDIEVRRDGDQRWLVIQAQPDDVWYKVLEFWQENGILLVEQDPTVGIMMTDWLENRADIKSDFITDRVRRIFDGLYSASIQDQYRIRIEEGEKAGHTELYLTHRGMEEKIIQSGGNNVERTVWNPRPTDHELEAEMLRRIMVYLGVSNESAQSALLAQGDRKPRSQLNRVRDEISLQISEPLERAWRLTGVALDRVGFAVEDRDRTKGIYFVRYNDPMKEKDDPGFFEKLAFWRDSDKNIDKENQYQVSLMSEGDATRVIVRDKAGTRDNSETAQRILTLINEQIQ